MMSVLLVAGISVLVGGLLAIGFGFPVKEFSFGNTLILSGVVAVCTGLIMLSLLVVVRELRALARRLGPANQATAERARAETPPVFAHPRPSEEPASDRPLFLADQLAPEGEDAEDSAAASTATPWREEAVRDRGRPRGKTPPVPPAAEAGPDKSRRNLLFSSSRKERAGSRTPDPAEDDLDSVMPAAPVSSPVPGPRATFEDAWPPPEPVRPDPYRRSTRAAPAHNDANAGAPARRDQIAPARTEDYPQVTVLKSGLVDGMAYSLYSDGSIEAQLPEGMMRFASIGELRAHLDQRP